jgi:hypothetical protein
LSCREPTPTSRPRVGSAWRKNLVLYRRALRLCIAERFTHRTPIVIYQMGKVGSTSILRSLRRHGIGPVFRIHALARENLHLLYPRHYEPGHPVVCADYRRYGLISRQLHRYIRAKHKPVKVITPVREPIARNVSLFFENLLEYHLPPGTCLDRLTPHELETIFLRDVRHPVPLDWFDLEMRPMLGIDVYAHPSPRKTGYSCIGRGNIDLLLLKIKIDDRLKERAIADFLGLGNFALEDYNVGQEKPYAGAYHRFVETVRLPAWYLETMTRSPYTRHFYTTGEIDQMWARWGGRD